MGLSQPVRDALDLLHSLRPGDAVILHQDGRAIGAEGEPLTVQPHGAGRSDGPYGSAESYGVTVGYGPGRWNTKITASALGGYGPIRKGEHVGRPTCRLERRPS
jgi:hypothetical protein